MCRLFGGNEFGRIHGGQVDGHAQLSDFVALLIGSLPTRCETTNAALTQPAGRLSLLRDGLHGKAGSKIRHQ
jgi:hypothetical protein